MLNSWLKSEEFQQIDRELGRELNTGSKIRFLIQVDDDLTQRLPWHLWNFFKDYSKAEIALSSSEYRVIPRQYRSEGQINILAILGNSKGIDVQKDREMLENLQGAKSEFLVEPQRKSLNDHLWEKSWDILFFAGHSQTEGETGRIEINQTDSLTIQELKYALQKAVKRGLKLAIFNSCDGLGLARALADLHIPQIIVMREPVPDLVAQEFLKYFLQEFADGKPLYLAVRAARERLQGLEDDFPAASWLPIICQHPASVPPTWQQLRDGIESDRTIPPINIESDPPKPHPVTRILTHPALVASVAITALVLGVRQLGWLQPLELKAYDRMMRLRPDEGPDRRLLVITIDEADLQYQDRMGMEKRWSLADAALNQLLKKLEVYQPRVIGLDIYRDFPVRREQVELAKQLRQNNNFIAVCKHSDPEANAPGIRPPHEVSEERLGFSDVVVDDDDVLRRQLLHLTPDPASPCRTKYALSLQLAMHYLAKQGIQPQVTPEGYLQFGKISFKPLETRTGGYKRVDAWGYQVLLNYRSYRSPQNIAPQISLREFLTNGIDPNAVKDRIVVIGVTTTNAGDYWSTPYGAKPNQKIPGVIIQAQMVSQIISAALDNRSLIWVWPLWGESLWIWGWSLVGGIVSSSRLLLRYQALGGGAALGTLLLICWSIFTQAGWIPLVPAALALVGTGGVILAYMAAQNKQQS
ncbi:CHASE2 domain-containing protein [Microseira wollei]|uniref:Chase2 sensor protein n=1 Tax=Microseira wollei NIES-4236 TaxID=2530354 RepID=A0AAV3WJ74_9CYAN|nr:CHASE2 domain-containing protein [Microseira wollei]GET39969.1 putative Chase2 sensor protein [Microseira wollei NIES-4236]